MPQRTIARREDDPPPPARGSVIGDNLPSLAGDAERLFDEMLAEREGFNDRVEALVDAGKRADALQIEDMDEGTAGRLGDTVVQVRAVIRVVEDAHKTVKAPYLEAGRAVDAKKNDLVDRLDGVKRALEGKQTAFFREEQRKAQEAERKRREEEARIAREREEALRKAEAENAPPPPPPPPPPPAPEPVREPEPIRGDYGTAVSRRTVKKCQVEDYDVAYIHVSKNTKVREAIDKAIAAQVRSGVEEIPGVRIWDDVAVSNR